VGSYKAQVGIQAAIKDFDDELPGAKAVRDAIEHFDEYSQGRGDLQQPDIRSRRKRQSDEDLARRYVIDFEAKESNPEALIIRGGP
jgi:hypothetical protein